MATDEMTYLNGAYRRHRPQDVARFTKLATDSFPRFAARIDCFGCDWLGRQFATDKARVVESVPQVLMLEPGTGEVLEIPVNESAFHKEELVQEADAAVAYSFFEQWIGAGGARPAYGQCVGYKQPLYLGGADEISNLELGDLDVYWTLSARLLAQTRGLPLGTRIRDVFLSE